MADDHLSMLCSSSSPNDHRERNHQGLRNRIIEAGDEVGKEIGDVRGRERLGCMLRYYYREAA